MVMTLIWISHKCKRYWLATLHAHARQKSTGCSFPFQIGRSSEDPIDFVVTDTIPGHQRNENDTVAQSTISRFACRILVDRNYPYAARIYAAGFDSGRNIFLGVSTLVTFQFLKQICRCSL